MGEITGLTRDIKWSKYHEPFLGGASIFLSLPAGTTAFLSDTNQDLIETYEQVRDHPDELAGALAMHINTRDHYYEMRAAAPDTALERAARFIFLNHTSFNGIYRVNLQGTYNVPYGERRTIRIPDLQHLREVAARFRSVSFSACDSAFYKGSNDATFDALTSYLDLCFQFVRDSLPQQFALGNSEGGFVFVNNGIEALLRIFSDVVEHLQRVQAINPREETAKGLFDMAEPYLVPAMKFFLEQTVEEGAEFRRMYGSAGRAQYWRRLQIAIQEAIPAFDPPGLADYIEDQKKEFNTESFNLIRDIEEYLNTDIRKRLEDDLGALWFKKGVPLKVYEAASALAAQKNRERETDDEIHPWSCLHLIDYQAVLSDDNDRWVRLFEKRYTRPGEEKKAGGWKAKTHWISELNRIRNENSHVGSVSVEEYDFLVGLNAWLEEDVY